MGKCYNLAFDSTSFYGGGNNNKRQYFVDWSFLPADKSFKVSFEYMSVAAATVLDTTAVMALSVNIGATNNFWATSTGIVSTQHLGSLLIGTTAGGTNGYYYAEMATNSPVYIRARPTQSLCEVHLHSGLSITANFNTPVPLDYVLTLTFEEHDYD